MEKQQKNKKISRRQMMGMLGLMLSPVAPKAAVKEPVEEEYDVLLKADGTTVKVAKSATSKAKVIQKNLSNKRLFNWLNNLKKQ